MVRVVDERSGLVFAGKLLHDSFRDDPRAVERFVREARLLAGLEHQNIVRVHELAVIDGREVIVMELVQGPSLQTVLARDGALPEKRVVEIARGIARGLQAAHHLGLVHRDLKPANVLLAPGDVAKIVDFGLARTTSLLGVDPSAFALVGTPDYMAPESVDPLAVDARSDIYALGCLLFEMTAGYPPFGGASPFAVLEAHQRVPVPHLPATDQRSPALIALLGALLAKFPGDRPQSAAAVVERLDALGQDSAGALVVTTGQARDEAALCTGCGAPLLAAIGVCFGCGVPTACIEPGKHSLLVVGPGGVAEKLDASLRQALVDWLVRRPQLGLSPQPLARKVPRLPFLVVSGISEPSAQKLAESLRGIGLEPQVCKGGPMALASMRSKTMKLSGRTAGILGCFTSGAVHLVKHLPLTGAVATTVLFAAAVFVGGWELATRPVTVRSAPSRPLEPALAAALRSIAGAVPTIRAAHHRDSLRGVLSRLLALEDTLSTRSGSVAQEAAELALFATDAALHLDRLEQELATVDLRNPGPVDRTRLHERDRLASRLLDTAARLDTLRVRMALTDAHQRTRAAGEALSELRFEVEALEEVASVGDTRAIARVGQR